MNLILTSVMSQDTGTKQINNYQDRAKPFHIDQHHLIKRWIDSANNIKTSGIIFYDQISDKLLSTANTTIKFKQETKLTRNNHCDNRFYIYKEYLQQNKDIDNVFLTDCNDVYFNKNPFDLISDKYDLYVGSEYRPSRWCNQRFDLINRSGVSWELPQDERTRYNMGIIGGRRDQVLKFLEHIVSYMNHVESSIGANTPAGILTLHNHFDLSRVFTGQPLHNHFRMPGKEDTEKTRGKSAIVHK